MTISIIKLHLYFHRKHCHNSSGKHSNRIGTRQAKAGEKPTHLYVDLAAFQNATKLPNTPYQYDKLVDAVVCVANRKASPKKSQHCKKHHRQKVEIDSSFLNQNSIFLKSPAHCSTNETPVKSQKTFEPVKKSAKKSPHVALGHSSSAHHLKHRNREEDQARAMAQVVRWLEQEFSTSEPKKEFEKTEFQNSKDKKSSVSSSSTSSIERHEHHHIHEHIHHHYHHYQETPIVV